MLESILDTKTHRKQWRVILIDGKELEVPRNGSRSERESIKLYGIDAILQRVSRMRYAKELMRAKNLAIRQCVRVIIKPSGEEVTLPLPIY